VSISQRELTFVSFEVVQTKNVHCVKKYRIEGFITIRISVIKSAPTCSAPLQASIVHNVNIALLGFVCKIKVKYSRYSPVWLTGWVDV